MYGSELCVFSFWWIVPVIMMVLCFWMMRRRRGAMTCGFGSRGSDGQPAHVPDSAMNILDRRYAAGDIDKSKYEEMKRTLAVPVDPESDPALRREDKQ